ncbi:DUF4268 domain-containing protein [Fulvivirgaceae bacterium BMA12]|uniref:DUF4268 domain-containing protein n=1 Tax=Agaribacillus aureus TaxID=3051825 RepID=A0ABT8LDG7_9BACT|nr:DUF4268 domain-containing protein [Fulvivirgaceae bacterium BMA12]
MYLINQDNNSIQKVGETTFRELGFRERDHLQEWIAKNPSCLNEELLIIQKEFSGFSDTNERLDLLALDKQGNLIVVENKLDDSGRDVTWQVLRYASYCSSLNTDEIINIFNAYLGDGTAQEKLEEFFESEDYEERLNTGNSQRIMMVSGSFRKEVTSTVLWLMNYGLRIQCFKATPFKMGEQLFINFEQVIPMREAEEFIISMAQKNRDNIEKQEELKSRHHIRREFWEKMLAAISPVSQLYQNVNASKDHWLSAGAGMSGVVYNTLITKSYVRIELTISGRSQEENKEIFDLLLAKKNQIEEHFGKPLGWERLDNKRMSRVKYEEGDVNLFNKEDWDTMIAFFVEYLPRFENAFKNAIPEVNRSLRK